MENVWSPALGPTGSTRLLPVKRKLPIGPCAVGFSRTIGFLEWTADDSFNTSSSVQIVIVFFRHHHP